MAPDEREDLRCNEVLADGIFMKEVRRSTGSELPLQQVKNNVLLIHTFNLGGSFAASARLRGGGNLLSSSVTTIIHNTTLIAQYLNVSLVAF